MPQKQALYCRVARKCLHFPAPSEPCVRLSTHTAQANRAGATAPASLSGLLQPLDFSSDDLLAAHPHLIHALRCRSQGRFTCSTSARFRVGYGPIQRVMNSPCLSAAGLGFLQHPAPTEDIAIPCGLGTDYSDLIGVFLFRIGEIQPGWEPAIPRSRWCVPSDV